MDEQHQRNEPASRNPDFTPAPLRARVDGWTAERQRGFLEALVQTRSVVQARRAVGMSRASAYRLRGRPDSGSFAAAWDAALVRPVTARSAAASALAASLWDRALNGRIVPVVRAGMQVGYRVRPDNAAALTLLRRYDRACAALDRRANARRDDCTKLRSEQATFWTNIVTFRPRLHPHPVRSRRSDLPVSAVNRA